MIVDERTITYLHSLELPESDMIEKIEQMAKDSERDFSGQVRFIIKEYIKMKETN